MFLSIFSGPWNYSGKYLKTSKFSTDFLPHACFLPSKLWDGNISLEKPKISKNNNFQSFLSIYFFWRGPETFWGNTEILSFSTDVLPFYTDDLETAKISKNGKYHPFLTIFSSLETIWGHIKKQSNFQQVFYSLHSVLKNY